MGLDRLTSLEPGSDEFLGLFRSFLTTKDKSKATLALSDEDAKVFIEITDMVCLSECPSVLVRQSHL